MLKKIYIIAFILLCSSAVMEAQRSKLNKGTSKSNRKKLQKEADKKSDYNKFNKLNAKRVLYNTDYIWTHETAQIAGKGGGDISIFTPSRYSYTDYDEVGASIGGMYFVPNIHWKRKHHEDRDWIISSMLRFYSYSPFLYFAQDMENTDVFPTDSIVPNSIAMKNELMVSRVYYKALKCGGAKKPHLVLTGGLAVDLAYAWKESNVDTLHNKFMMPRGGMALGNSVLVTARAQADMFLMRNVFVTVAVRGLVSGAPHGTALEQNTSLRVVVAPKFSISAGYWLSTNKGLGTKLMPTVDLTYHIGYKKGLPKGLF